MTILHAWAFFNEELRYHVNYLAREQSRAGHDVAILCGATVKPIWRPYVKEQAPAPGASSVDGVTVHRLPVFGPANKPMVSLGQLRATIEAVKPDVVHVFGLPQVFSAEVLEAVRRWAPDVPVVVNDHSNPTRLAPGALGSAYYSAWRALIRRYRGQIHALVSPNEGTLGLHRRQYPFLADRAQVIPLGFDGARYQPIPGLRNQEDRLVVGFAGKIDPAKRVDRLIRCVAEAGLTAQVRCLIAGSDSDSAGHIADLMAMAAESGVEVEWLPLLEPAELAALYSTVDVACFPGSISITTLEATGCGAPVLLFRSIPGLEDRVSDGRGSLFSEDQELVALLHDMLTAKRAGAIDHAGVALASRPQAWAEIAVAYEQLYESVTR